MTQEQLQSELNWLDGLLKAGNFDGADDYYWTKNEYYKVAAKLHGMTQTQLNPVGFWHGMQSN